MPSSEKKRPVVFGEILFDTFQDGERVLGGAPFNVAWHLQGFGFHPVMISRIGRDDAGCEVLDSMYRWDMDTSGIQVDDNRSTGKVQVRIHNDEPSYDIIDKQAYDHINDDECRASLESTSAGLLYGGSLALRHDDSRNCLFSLVNTGLPLFVDINLRPPWWTRNLVLKLLDAATWLKLNEDELQIISGKEVKLASIDEVLEETRHLRDRHDIHEIIVTLGERGAARIGRDYEYLVTPAPVENLVDTVGAGDALSAVCIAGILGNWENELALARAVTFAAEICKQQGATSIDTEMYKKVMGGWLHE